MPTTFVNGNGQVQGEVLHQIKESYEGMSCSAIVSSEGGEPSKDSFHNNPN